MKQSHLFTTTRKKPPADEVARNAQLLIRAGYIHKEMAGVYSFLPLGLRVLGRIVESIRREMDAIGGQEILLSALQDPKVWEASGRWDDGVVDIWFKTKIKAGAPAGLAFTHEEPLTRLMKNHIRSYKDLPVFPYQFQTKFRNETRAKSGILRGREFLMKDLYSFCRDGAEHEVFYKKVIDAYKRIFADVGIGEKTHLTLASGGSFSKHSHEFQTVCESGEDVIHLCARCGVAVNDDVILSPPTCPECGGGELQRHASVEVGNIFTLGTRFSEALGLFFLDKGGERRPAYMGSYGIGPGRLMGTIVELHSDERGLVWPAKVAPFAVHLIALADALSGAEVARAAEGLYDALVKRGIPALYDDRDLRAGEKFADADLIGIPLRVVVSEKTLSQGKYEVKDRKTGAVQMLSESELLQKLA